MNRKDEYKLKIEPRNFLMPSPEVMAKREERVKRLIEDMGDSWLLAVPVQRKDIQ